MEAKLTRHKAKVFLVCFNLISCLSLSSLPVVLSLLSYGSLYIEPNHFYSPLEVSQ